MANRRITTMDLMEMLRLLRAGESERTLSQVLKQNRRTIAKYRAWAAEQGFLTGGLPTSAEVQRRLTETRPPAVPPQQTSSLAAYRDEIAAYRARGMEMAAIRGRLEEQHQRPVSYSAVRRLVQQLEPARPAETFVRVEVKPGSEAQVDFGYVGLQIDPATGKERKAWVFVLVLSWSRHLYAEVVFDQRVETWLLCHRHAFDAFGGVPARIVPDNLKAAIVRASFTEPVAQRAYRECAEHYDFLIDPNPPRTPHLKGKVEKGGVHYVTRNFFAGRSPEPIDELNRRLRVWTEETAGRRVHGTTKQIPGERFAVIEQAALRPLPPTEYDLALWKAVTLYRDCYVTFEQSFYSAPHRLVGQTLWVRGGARTVQIYTPDHALVATHDRATEPGERHTILDHLPPTKIPGLLLTREQCRAQATAIGPATGALVEDLLDHRPEDRLRVAGRLLRLAQKTSPERLERACARARHFGAADYLTVRRILHEGLEDAALAVLTAPIGPADGSSLVGPDRPVTDRRFTFLRDAGEFVASFLGGAR